MSRMKTNAPALVPKTGWVGVGLSQANGNMCIEYLLETCGTSIAYPRGIEHDQSCIVS